MTLYNLHSTADPSAFAITKFTRHGNVESHYTVSASTCDCPAGQRPTCRHRMMLPNLLPLLNTHYFWDHERGIAVDLDGVPKSYYDSLEPHSPTVTTTDFDSVDGGSTPPVAANPWRRL